MSVQRGNDFLLAEPETTTSFYNQLIVFSSNEEGTEQEKVSYWLSLKLLPVTIIS